MKEDPTESIERKAYEIYQKDGQDAVLDFAKKHGDEVGVTWGMCEPCESESPMLNGTCLVCGTPTWEKYES